ncbi:hypothetical protein W97_03235 [Coniosporium apollinis CBS 100218]|uniref:Uncharacterized protein n=1 Tax=Coniosporium apollinis (strain CBS 100218) TaxID=1168221 RepID=R7YQ12_CONA1|nr:uncharacterized protein W97_03235 [Coniosporium apollinis CBS 100218]EON64005.1 hypothetical protein W97_03235 [Coniosporium apollinis CBS 100218]
MSSSSSQIGLEAGTQRPQSRPRLVKLFPFWGYGSVLTACLGLAGCIAILIYADDSPREKWRPSPTVYLSIFVAMINISLHLAHAEGLNIAWWKRAMDRQASPDRLHETWERADSLYMAFASVHRFDPIALATIFVAFAPIAGPLLQRAVKPAISGPFGSTLVNVSIAEQLPMGWSGYYTGRSMNTAFTTQNFSNIVYEFNVNQEQRVTAEGCDGECLGKIRAAGFRVNCSESTIPFDLVPKFSDDGVTQLTYPDERIFASYANFSFAEPEVIQVAVLHKPTGECSGDLVMQTCSLTLGSIEYPVIFEPIEPIDPHNNTRRRWTKLRVYLDFTATGLGLDPSATDYGMTGDAFLAHTSRTFRPSAVIKERDGDTFSTIGGVALALNGLYASEARSRFIGARGYEVTTQGSLAAGFSFVEEEGLNTAELLNTPDGCRLGFWNPIDQILYAAHEFMFRSAIAATEYADPIPQLIKASRGKVPVWKSDIHYLGAAIVFSCLGIIFVTPLFNGFWRLSSFPSMSPIETAKCINQHQRSESNQNVSGSAYEMKTPIVREKEVGSQS